MTKRIYNPKRVYRYWLNPVFRLLVAPQDLQFAVNIYRSALKHGRFLATMRRSGTYYLYALLSAADNAEKTGSVEYKYETDKISGTGTWRFEYENRVPNNLSHMVNEIRAGKLDNLSDRFFVISHFPSVRPEYLYHPDWMKSVILLRDPLEAAESTFNFHYDEKNEKNHKDCLERWIPLIPKFMNYWGEYKQCDEKDVLIIKNEDLTNAQLETVKELSRFWNINYGNEAIKKAIKKCTKDEMISKIPYYKKENNKRVTVNKIEFSTYEKDLYANYLRNSIDHYFGYEL